MRPYNLHKREILNLRHQQQKTFLDMWHRKYPNEKDHVLQFFRINGFFEIWFQRFSFFKRALRPLYCRRLCEEINKGFMYQPFLRNSLLFVIFFVRNWILFVCFYRVAKAPYRQKQKEVSVPTKKLKKEQVPKKKLVQNPL